MQELYQLLLPIAYLIIKTVAVLVGVVVFVNLIAGIVVLVEWLEERI